MSFQTATIRSRILIVILNLILAFIGAVVFLDFYEVFIHISLGLLMFSKASWISQLSSSESDLHLNLFQPLLGSCENVLLVFTLLICLSCLLGIIAAASATKYTVSMVNMLSNIFMTHL